MSVGFDPLHQWLGIPPEEQPPHYYRLLGISLFEDNPDVIEVSADRQMAFLRTFYGGPYASYAQGLLNVISAARVCLLNRDQKAEYDAWLRQQIMPPSAPPEPEASYGPEVGEYQDVVGDSGDYAPPLPRAAREGFPWVGILAVLMAVAGVGVLVMTLLKTSENAPREGAIIVQWPEDERLRSLLQLDGRTIRLPLDGQDIELRVATGPHQVTFSRPGYETYEQTLTVEPGGRSAIRPVWQELAQQVDGAGSPEKAEADEKARAAEKAKAAFRARVNTALEKALEKASKSDEEVAKKAPTKKRSGKKARPDRGRQEPSEPTSKQ